MKRWWRQIAALALLLLLTIGLWQGRYTLLNLFSDRDAIEALLVRWGPWAPVAIIVAEMLQVLLAPIPGQIMGVVAGFVYGIWWGTLLCMVGLLLGTALAVWMSRQVGRPLVERVVPSDRLARLDGYFTNTDRGRRAILFIFLLPFLPDDLTCLVAGLTPLRLGHIVLLALIGRLPGVLASCWIGSQADALTWVQITALFVFSFVLVLVFMRYQSRLETLMFGLVDRLSKRVHKG